MLLAAANLHHHSLHVLVVATTTARAVAFKDYVRAAAMAKRCCCYLLSSCLAAAALHAVVGRSASLLKTCSCDTDEGRRRCSWHLALRRATIVSPRHPRVGPRYLPSQKNYLCLTFPQLILVF